jgi:hypothetical protein
MERRLAAILAADMVGYSRLMELDEEGVLLRQKAHRREMIDPEIESSRGHIIKTTGDGMLVEFAAAQDAVRCAIDIQTAMADRESASTTDSRITLSEPGGVCVSDIVHQAVADRIGQPFRDMGSQRVKNISRPIRVWQWTPDAPPEDPEITQAGLHQRVRFATAPDGVQIAWASIGEGPPVLKAPNWLNHLEYEWRSPIWGPVLTELAHHCRLVRFDQRGNGLSDWEVEEISHDMMVRWSAIRRRSQTPRGWSGSRCSAFPRAAHFRSATPSRTRNA